MTENRGKGKTTKGRWPWREGIFLGPNHWLQIRHIHNKTDTTTIQNGSDRKNKKHGTQHLRYDFNNHIKTT